jgi:hypothetical protein
VLVGEFLNPMKSLRTFLWVDSVEDRGAGLALFWEDDISLVPYEEEDNVPEQHRGVEPDTSMDDGIKDFGGPQVGQAAEAEKETTFDSKSFRRTEDETLRYDIRSCNGLVSPESREMGLEEACYWGNDVNFLTAKWESMTLNEI